MAIEEFLATINSVYPSPGLLYTSHAFNFNVCFPSGTSVFDDTLYIYYGAADEQIAYATISMTELLNELLLNKITDAK